MYLGNALDKKEFTYFLPLLLSWETAAKKDYIDKLKLVENLQQIKIVTKANSFDFPEQAKIFFSHGGYRMIYQTFSNGDTCLCVRDIINASRDEENRETPFNILITASGDDDVKRLDNFALYYTSNVNRIKELYGFLAKLFSYDPIVNGIKFNLAAINGKLNDAPKSDREIAHKPDRVVFLIMDSISMAQTAFNELRLLRKQIDLIADINGNYKGALDFKEPPVSAAGAYDRVNEVSETEGNEGTPTDAVTETNLNETGTNGDSEITSPDIINLDKSAPVSEDVRANADKTDSDYNNLESVMATILDALSSNSASLKDIQSHLSNSRTEEYLDRLLHSVENIQNCQSVVETNDGKNHDMIIISNTHLWLIGLAFILGLLLGGILF